MSAQGFEPRKNKQGNSKYMSIYKTERKPQLGSPEKLWKVHWGPPAFSSQWIDSLFVLRFRHPEQNSPVINSILYSGQHAFFYIQWKEGRDVRRESWINYYCHHCMNDTMRSWLYVLTQFSTNKSFTAWLGRYHT